MTNLVVTPSRFDKSNHGNLLCSVAGNWLRGMVSRYDPHYNIVPYEKLSTAPPADKWLVLGKNPTLATIGAAHEGYTYSYRGARTIPTFDAQEANDFFTDEDEDDDGESPTENKDRSPTRHANYRHWIAVHIDKLYNPRLNEPQPRFELRPSLQEVIRLLRATSGSNLYLDIETRPDYGLLCVGLATDTSPIYCVPCYDYTGKLVYSKWSDFWRELNEAGLRNTLVIHNSMFDLVVMGKYYQFYGVDKVFDTMIAQHRIAPEAEKSLGHCIAQWTELPYHKDGFIVPNNSSQEDRLYTYNCKDIWTMRLIRKAQLNYARSDKGLMDSIESGNKLVKPFLINSLQGIPIDVSTLEAVRALIAMECEQLYKILTKLLGFELNCASPQKVGNYLYDTMGYKPPGRAGKSERPTDKKALYALATTTGNPALKVIIKLKAAQKRASMLKFVPYPGTGPEKPIEATLV